MQGARKSYETSDPLEAIAVRIPWDGEGDGLEAMARCFIEEYARMGWDPPRIAKLFANPYFAGTNGVLELRGSDWVQRLIGEVFGPTAAEGGD